jgi:rhodanese-related sulfurtransferase
MESEKIELKNKKNDSVVALGIGFVLIILAILVFIVRSAPSEKNSGTSSSKDQKEIIKGVPISSTDLLKKIGSKEKILIIDVRSSDMFLAEHILDSKNIAASNFENYFKNADKKATYIIIDSSGIESSQLSYKFSKDFGIPNMYYLENGFDSWKSQLNPTIKEGDPTSISDQSKVQYIKSDELKKFVDEENMQIKILDIRKQQIFNEGHIKNSINIPYDQLEAKRGDLPRGKNLIVVDTDAVGAFKAAVKLFDMGFFNILVLSDGLDAWKQKGFELVK